MKIIGGDNSGFKHVSIIVLLLHLVFGVVHSAGQGLPYIDKNGVQTGQPLVNSVLEAKFPAGWLADLYAADGTALMDELYVALSFSGQEAAFLSAGFGLSIESGRAYLFVFDKQPDGTYSVYNFYDTTIQNLVLTGKNGKRLWFTGTVDNAFAGGKTDEGFIYIKGTDGERVDIYLHDWQVNAVQSKDLGDFDLNDFMRGTVFGMASPFSVGSDGEDEERPFTAAFHIRGDNRLTGGAASTYTATGVMGVLAEIIAQAAPSIAIRPIEKIIGDVENKSCKLVFDDWYPVSTDKQVRTNGKLEMPVRENRAAPSIDLGNAHGRCEFDGGQYGFTTAVSNSMFYVSSMAVCYRMLQMMGTVYGVGSSAATPDENSGNYPSVYIKDGTFFTYSAADMQSVLDVVAHGWYNDYTDLRLPVKTRIDGGTFSNCEVYACDASAEQGKAPVNTAGDQLCRNAMSVGAPAIDGLGTVELSLPDYPYYGTASLTPVEESDGWLVYPYLPGTCGDNSAAYVHNWVTIIPQMGYEGLLTMGGNVEVFDKEPDGSDRTNAYLFYAQLNEWTKQYASVDFGFVQPTVEDAIRLGGNKEFSEVSNTANYTIKYGLYTMLSFQSNQWYTICPPYDVHNIYVLETLPDNKLAENNLTKEDKGTEKYLKAQGGADGILAQGIVTSLCPDILSGKGSGTFMSLIDICKKTLDLPPYKLTYYNPDLQGHTAAEANYYLYEQLEEEDPYGDLETGYWPVMETLDDYSKKWKYVKPVQGGDYTAQDGKAFSADILMKQGNIYSLFLPAGADNYWEGKYLVFEGYGPQTVQGKNALTDVWSSDAIDIIYEDVADDVLFLQGNATFGNMETESPVFLPVTTPGSTHDFTRTEAGNVLKPWDVYMAMSTANTDNFASLSALCGSRQGQSLRMVEEVAAGNLPRMADKSLLAYDADGIVLKAFQRQRIAVYAADGVLIWQGVMNDGDIQVLPVTAGVYVIKGEAETVKLVTGGNR